MGELFGKVGVLTDVHGDAGALEMVLEFLDGLGIGTVLCGGDIADGDSEVEECCRILRDRGIPTVRGNHDRWYCQGIMRELPESTLLGSLSAESVDWLKSLPRTLSFESAMGRVLLCHGLRENDMATFRPGDYGYGVEVNEELQSLVREQEYRVVISGHSHESMVRTYGGITFINPGALWRPHGGDFVVIDFERREVTLYSVESSRTKTCKI